ncbi:hypothetical protein WA158_004778 [Blastocystis sp. Blastoise]
MDFDDTPQPHAIVTNLKYKGDCLLAHQKKINSIAWNCSGQWLATGSADGTILIWSTHRDSHPQILKRSYLYKLEGHTRDVQQIVWHPSNPSQLYSIADDRTIKYWDLSHSGGYCVATIKTKYDNIYLAISSGAKYLSTGSKNNYLNIYDLNKNREIACIHYNWDIYIYIYIYEMCWTKNEKYLLLTTAANSDGWGRLEVLQPANNKINRVLILPAHTSRCCCIHVNPRGDTFITGSADSFINFWDLDEFICFKTIKGERSVRALRYNFNGKYLATCNKDNYVTIYNTETGEEVMNIRTSSYVDISLYKYRYIYIDIHK